MYVSLAIAVFVCGHAATSLSESCREELHVRGADIPQPRVWLGGRVRGDLRVLVFGRGGSRERQRERGGAERGRESAGEPREVEK
jgi:hypothetical protein